MADITYCGDDKCRAKECARHPSHIAPGEVVSTAMFDCPYMPLDRFHGYATVTLWMGVGIEKWMG